MEQNENRIVKCKIQVVKILFQSFENDFKIFKARMVEGYEEYPSPENNYSFSVKGNCPELDVYKTTYILEAEEYVDDKYGLTYKILSLREDLDVNDIESQKNFLKKFLTNKEYISLFSKFDNPLKAIKDGEINSLTEIKGIGPATINKILTKVEDNEGYGNIYMKLKIDLPINLVKSLVKKYSSPDLVVQKIKENPYILSSEVKGIGFKKADEIALSYGIKKNDPKRIQAYIIYALSEIENKDGHLWITMSDLVYNVKNYIETSTVPEIVANIKKMIETKTLYYQSETKKIGLYSYYLLEYKISQEIKRIKNNIIKVPEDWKDSVKNLELTQGWEFNEEQYQAIETALKNPFTVITGSAGVGKSSTAAGILYALPGIEFAQCALSGKAANRLTEVTNFEGKTIHRLLKFDPNQGFYYGKNNKLPCELVLLDEGSMVGGDIFLKLLEAVSNNSRLIILGDIDQLDAIGLGSAFKDIIASNAIPTVKLIKIMRQAEKSGIITESQKIAKSVQITENNFHGTKTYGELQDFTVHCEENQNILLEISNCYKNYINKVNSIMDLQFICPMRERGEISCKNINSLIQNLYNPKRIDKNEIIIKGSLGKCNYILREGDKVINRKNNYNTLNTNGETTFIYNGNIGIIERIEYSSMIINFDEIGKVVINNDFYKNIELAYCITTHLSQGSQFDYVIYAFDMSSYILLNKEQLYTAVSRAKVHCDLYAENKALQLGIKTSKAVIKHTWLKDLLKEQ